MLSFAEQAAWSGLTFMLIAILPGPNVLLVGWLGMSQPRSHALCGALGVAAGVTTLASLVAVLPLTLAASTEQPIGRVVFALLLWWFGFRALTWPWRNGRVNAERRRGAGPAPRRPLSRPACFGSGFATAIANPLTLAFLAGQMLAHPPLASAADPGPMGPGTTLAMIAGISGTALLWYVVVACGAARPTFRRFAERHVAVIAPVVGILLVWWAIKASLALLARAAASQRIDG